MPGAEHLRDCNQLIQMLKKQKTEGKYFAAICASPSVVFDHHKLLEGHKACGWVIFIISKLFSICLSLNSYPCFKLPTEIAAEKNPRVVVSGNCITRCDRDRLNREFKSFFLLAVLDQAVRYNLHSSWLNYWKGKMLRFRCLRDCLSSSFFFGRVFHSPVQT